MHNPCQPGEVLKPALSEISVTDAAKRLGVGRVALSSLVNGATGISPDMALRLSKALGTSPKFWYRMQVNYDPWQAKKKFRGKVRSAFPASATYFKDRDGASSRANSTVRYTVEKCCPGRLRRLVFIFRGLQPILFSIKTIWEGVMNAVARATASEMRTQSRAFHLWMAAGYVIVAFGGFVPTYWAKLAAGTFAGPPILHVHGLMMFSWVGFYFFQTWLVATGRTANHRNWGLVGISLFTLLMCSILVGQTVITRIAAAQGFADAALRFSAVPLCAWPLMAGFFIAAIANIHRPEVHKRWMIVLLTGMMTPAIGRVFLTLFAPAGAAAGAPPPPFVSLPPALLADLFLLIAIVRDWRVLGRPHPVYLWGGAVLLAQQVLTVPFAATATWMTLAQAFQRLTG